MDEKNHKSHNCCAIDTKDSENSTIRKVLYIVFFINLGMFLVEVTGGIIAGSNALLADSLDMLGDAFVYGISLAIFSKHPSIRAKGSMIKGVIMLSLGLFVIGQNIFKALYPTLPTAEIITWLGALALIANLISYSLLLKYRNKDLNMRSSWLCTRNDVLANVGVIVAGVLVAQLHSMWPDILIGSVIAAFVVYSSIQIIREARMEAKM